MKMVQATLTVWFILLNFWKLDRVQSFQYPLHYQYQFKARVMAAIPDINQKQMAASDILAQINVYFRSPSSIRFKFEDVQVAEFNGKSDCVMEDDDPLPVTYRRPTNNQTALIGKHPFEITILSKGTEYAFHEDEPAWLLIFYKTVITTFITAPLRTAVFGTSEKKLLRNDAYVIQEPSVMGQCNFTYSQFKLSGLSENEYRRDAGKLITSDIQVDSANPSPSSKGNSNKSDEFLTNEHNPDSNSGIPTLSNQIWQVTRSVDLENCDTLVEYQRTLSGVHCSLARGQCKNILSRNSQGVYFLKGGPSGVRLEKATVSGAIIVAPFGFETDALISRSYQKIELKSVSTLGSNTSTVNSSENNKDELQLILLPEDDFKIRSPIIGLSDTKDKVVGHIQAVYENLFSYESSDGSIQSSVRALSFASSVLAELTQEDMEDFITYAMERLPPLALDLLHGVLAEVGTPPAVTYLLQEMKSGNITALRQALFFGTMNVNIKNPSALKLMLDFLRSEDLGRTPFKTAQSFVNFATLVHRLCVGSEGMFDQISRDQCRKDFIDKHFTDLVVSQLQETTIFWKQIVLVKTLVNLRSVDGFKPLTPFILGTVPCDTMVRLVAMEALAGWNAHGYLEQQRITLLLLELFENPTENLFVRSRALGYLVSWPLTSTMWKRLALSTHHPMLRDLAAFTYSVIEAAAAYKHPETVDQSVYASHALRLAKTMAPSQRYSSYRTWINYLFPDKIGTIQQIQTIKDPLSPIPSEIIVYLQRNLGGMITFTKLDAMLANDWGDLDLVAIELFLNKPLPYQDLGESGPWDDIISQMKDGLNISERGRSPIRGLVNAVNIFGSSSTELMLPLQFEFISDLMTNLFDSPYLDTYGLASLYFNSPDLSFVSTNDVGLPVEVSSASATLMGYNGTFYFSNTGPNKYTTSTQLFAFRYEKSTTTNVKVVAPWSDTKLEVGVSRSDNVLLPFDGMLDIYLPHKNKARSGFNLIIDGMYGSENVSLYTSITVPYTMKYNLSTHLNLTYLENAKLKILSSNESTKLSLQNSLPNIGVYSFAAGNARYGNDFISDLLSSPSNLHLPQRHAKFSISKFMFDFNYLNDTQLRVNYTYTTHGPDIGGSTPLGVNNNQDNSSVDDVREGVVEHLSFGAPDASEPILENYMSYMRQEQNWKETIFGHSLRVELKGKGPVEDAKNKAELVFVYREQSLPRQIKKTEGVAVFSRMTEPASTLCADFRIDQPNLSDMDTTLESFFSKIFSKNVTTSFYVGEGCKDGPFAEFNVNRDFSPGTLENLKEDLSSCSPFVGHPMEFIANNIHYDRATGSIKTHPVAGQSTRQDDYKQRMKDLLNYFFHGSNKNWVTPGGDFDVHFDVQKNEDGSWRGNYNDNSNQSGNNSSSKELNFKIPSALNLFMSSLLPSDFEFVNDAMWKRMDRSFGDFCVINKTSLVTFDGHQETLSLGGCPTLAVTQCEAGSYDSFTVSVNVSQSGGMNVYLAVRYKQLVININSDAIQVNGETVLVDRDFEELTYRKRYRRETSAGWVEKYKGGFMVVVEDTLMVIFRDETAYLKVYHRYFGYLCGLCGNHDNEPVNDMKQPNGCLLTDAQRFRQTWTVTNGVRHECDSSDGYSSDDGEQQCIEEGTP